MPLFQYISIAFQMFILSLVYVNLLIKRNLFILGLINTTGYNTTRHVPVALYKS